MKYNNIFALRKAAASLSLEECGWTFSLSPSQAVLLWWGLKHLENDLSDAVANVAGADDYPEAIRDFAEAIEWCRLFRRELGSYAHKNQLETSP